MKKILKFVVFLCGIVTMIPLVSCSNDNNESDDSDSMVTGASYYIMLNPANTSGDQTNFVNTTITITDKTSNREILKKEVVLDALAMTPVEVTSESLVKSFPFEIKISQTLKSGIDLTQKSSYKLGLQITIAVSSYDSDNKVINTKLSNERSSKEISAKDLSTYFPKTISYVYHIDKNGVITTE